MGVIDNLRNKFNKAKVNEYNKSNTQNETMERKVVELFSPKVITKAIHSNGETTQIITAKVNIYNSGDATLLGDGQIPICVEIPENTSIEDILNNKRLLELYEMGYFNRMTSEQYNMLGRITLENGIPRISGMSPKVVNGLQKLNLDDELKKESDQLYKKYEQRNMESKAKEEALRQRLLQEGRMQQARGEFDR